MALPWVRLDSNIAIHDKILSLLADSSPRRYQAAASYMFALGWCGASGTDGHVPAYALVTTHGTPQTAALLVKHRLWVQAVDGGWFIPKYEEYQELAEETRKRKAAERLASAKANCVRWHGKDCGCWKEQAA